MLRSVALCYTRTLLPIYALAIWLAMRSAASCTVEIFSAPVRK